MLVSKKMTVPMQDNLLTRLLNHLTWPRLLLIFAVLILPTVFAPYHSDDFFHLLLLREDPLLARGGDGSLFGLFSFIDTDPVNRQQMISLGVLPWWTTETFYFRFWRPLAEVSHWLDYRLFGDNPMVAHLHSIAWFLALGAVVYWLARRTLVTGLKTADARLFLLLALAIFLWDGQHVATITWIANRNALMAAVLAFISLLLHMRWREEGRIGWGISGHLILGLALLAGEIALSVGAYLFAYAMLLDPKGKVRGFIALLGYLVVAVAYLLVHRQLGFGADTSLTFYISPFTHPIGFLEIAAQRFPVYIASAFFPVPAGISWAGGETFKWFSWLLKGLAFVLLPVIGWLGYRLVRGYPAAGFWLLGGILSIIPVCSALPQDRLTLFMTVGIDLFLAWLIFHTLVSLAEIPRFKHQVVRKLAGLMAVFHLLFSPMHLLAGSTFMLFEVRRLEHHALHFNQEPLADKTLVIFQLSIGQSSTLLGIRHWYGAPIPNSSLLLASDEGDMTVTVVSPHRLLIEKPMGFAVSHESAFRGIADDPLLAGDKVPVKDAVITITGLNSVGYPDRLQIDFDQNLYGGDVIFYTQRGLDLEPVKLPPVGSSFKTR